MIGQTLGSYRIVSEIGSGGMGVVYLAEHALIGRKVAVKLLRTDMPSEYVERFFNEAKAAAKLHHPGLVDVFDFGHHSDGRAFIVMEFLNGESLADRLAREPRLPVALGCTIARGVANALHVAHEEGIIHRDLKPGNIFLLTDADAPGGIRPKVLDFGIAKLVRERDARSVKTQSGAVIGTPRYMSPEQCKNARNVDGRSDIYSLGCILYEMLLGVAPFDYDSWAELVGAHIYEHPPKPTEIDPKVPADIETLLTKMLEKSPDARFQSMHDLAQSLEVLIVTHGGDPARIMSPGLQRVGATPSQGVKKYDSGEDPTLLPASKRDAPTPVSRPSQPLPLAPTLPPHPTPTMLRAKPAAIAPPARKPPYLAIALAAAGLIASAVAVLIVVGKERKSEQEPAFIVVDQRGSDGSNAAAVVDAAVMDPVAAPVVDAAIAAPPPDPKSPKVPKTIDVDALTRTFGKQSPAITACFKKHPDSSTEQISVRIQIDPQGIVQAAEVLPAPIGKTALGGCLADVARSTRFGPQPKSATFRVPLVKAER
jgi:serine/threonine protein kinase